MAVLLAPLAVTVALAIVVVDSQNDRYNDARLSAELAELASDVSALDQALSEEALAGSEVVGDPDRWDEFVSTYAAETDLRLQAVKAHVDLGATCSEALRATAEVMSYREDLRDGLVTPLQVSNRYAVPRAMLLNGLVASDVNVSTARLIALIEARSAHLDERFASQLAIRYQSWAPGQYAAVNGAIAVQTDRLLAAYGITGEDQIEVDPGLSDFRSQVRLSTAIPATSQQEYVRASDLWLATINVAIAQEARATQSELQSAAAAAQRARTLTVLSASLGTLVAVFVAGVMSYRMVSRMERLATFAGQMTNGGRRLVPVAADVGGSDELSELAFAFDEMVGAVRQRDRQLAAQAQTDELTTLLNRRAILQHWRRLVERSRGTAYAFSIDLDGFKPINDRYGHHTGDAVLVEAAARMREAIGDRRAVVGRIGGDEFLAILHTRHVDDEIVEQLGSDLLAALEVPFAVEGREVALTASVGVAVSRQDVPAMATLREADYALYRVKAEGGSAVRVSNDELREAMERSEADRTAIRLSVERGDFEPVYQPIVDRQGRVLGFEALARLHRSDGIASPDEFMDLLEHERLLPELDRLMLEKACDALAGWRHPDRLQLRVSVNISAEFLNRDDAVVETLGILSDAGVPPEQLILEITESGLMSDTASNARKLGELRKHGVLVAVDDYGTGYSSLGYIQQLPIDFLKLDRQFAERIDENPRNQAIARSVLSLAADLGVLFIAEGIERQEEHEWFVNSGASYLQGFVVGRPSSLAEAQRFLLARGQSDACRVGAA